MNGQKSIGTTLMRINPTQSIRLWRRSSRRFIWKACSPKTSICCTRRLEAKSVTRCMEALNIITVRTATLLFVSACRPLVLKDGPRCTECGGVIKPDIVFYGENLDGFTLSRAYEMFNHAQLCLVLGSSLIVQPAASFPAYTVHRGAPLVIVNAQKTSFDSSATLRFTDLQQFSSALADFLPTLESRKPLGLTFFHADLAVQLHAEGTGGRRKNGMCTHCALIDWKARSQLGRYGL